ncbi:hypothetical protein O9X98_09755 [Agrobacterium salinitolerans]|nr:hypothetical protein [Agrobacterium salinitolerans]
MFSSTLKAPLFRFGDPVISNITLKDGVVHLHDRSFRACDVMVAVINFDPSPEGDVYGSALFKTREFDHLDDLVQRKYSFSFNEAQLETAREVAAAINASGGSVKLMAIGDGAFRHTFFGE